MISQHVNALLGVICLAAIGLGLMQESAPKSPAPVGAVEPVGGRRKDRRNHVEPAPIDPAPEPLGPPQPIPPRPQPGPDVIRPDNDLAHPKPPNHNTKPHVTPPLVIPPVVPIPNRPTWFSILTAVAMVLITAGLIYRAFRR